MSNRIKTKLRKPRKLNFRGKVIHCDHCNCDEFYARSKSKFECIQCGTTYKVDRED